MQLDKKKTSLEGLMFHLRNHRICQSIRTWQATIMKQNVTQIRVNESNLVKAKACLVILIRYKQRQSQGFRYLCCSLIVDNTLIIPLYFQTHQSYVHEKISFVKFSFQFLAPGAHFYIFREKKMGVCRLNNPISICQPPLYNHIRHSMKELQGHKC